MIGGLMSHKQKLVKFTCFRATRCPVPVSRAANTLDVRPRPISSSTVYLRENCSRCQVPPPPQAAAEADATPAAPLRAHINLKLYCPAGNSSKANVLAKAGVSVARRHSPSPTRQYSKWTGDVSSHCTTRPPPGCAKTTGTPGALPVPTVRRAELCTPPSSLLTRQQYTPASVARQACIVSEATPSGDMVMRNRPPWRRARVSGAVFRHEAVARGAITRHASVTDAPGVTLVSLTGSRSSGGINSVWLPSTAVSTPVLLLPPRLSLRPHGLFDKPCYDIHMFIFSFNLRISSAKALIKCKLPKRAHRMLKKQNTITIFKTYATNNLLNSLYIQNKYNNISL